MDGESRSRPLSTPPPCRWAVHLGRGAVTNSSSSTPPSCQWMEEPVRGSSVPDGCRNIERRITPGDHSAVLPLERTPSEGNCVDADGGSDEASSMQDLLSRQLGIIQQVLISHHDKAMRLAAQHAQAAAQAEAEVADLLNENSLLREKLITAGLSAQHSGRSETGGTGDSRLDAVAKRAQVPCSLRFLKGQSREFVHADPRPLLLGPTSRPSSRAGAANVGAVNHMLGGDGGDRSASPTLGPPPPRQLPSQPLPPPDPVQDMEIETMMALPGAIASIAPVDAGMKRRPVTPAPACENEEGGKPETHDGVPEDVEAFFQLLTTWWDQQKRLDAEQAPVDTIPATVRGFAGVLPSAASAPKPGDSEKAAKPDKARKFLARSSRSRCSTVEFDKTCSAVSDVSARISVLGLSARASAKARSRSPVKKTGSGNSAARKQPNQKQAEGAKQRNAEHEKGVFADAAAMKEKLRQAIGKPEYNVSDFYHGSGIWQWIARSHHFENFTLAVIALNAIWIAVDTDHNESDMLLDADLIFQLAEHGFCTFFLFEWFVRFMAFRRKLDGLNDFWFVFDTTLMLTMVVETWLLTGIMIMGSEGTTGFAGDASMLKLLRLVRLSRMARMARLFKAMPELMIMIKGITVAMRSVFFTLCLLVCIVYVFAVAFVQLLGPRGALSPSEEAMLRFPDVWGAMKSLVIGGILPDQEELILGVSSEHFATGCMITLFILLASLTVMNMLVGVLCEVVSVVSAVEKETLLVNFVKSQLMALLETNGFDADGDNRISKVEFEALLGNEGAARALTDLGVDAVGLVDFIDFIFENGRSLTFSEFMEVVLELRGSNTATVKDIVDLRKVVLTELEKVKDLERVIEKSVAKFPLPEAAAG